MTPRLSCNGCRVLRKGCSESCSIRPCLQWIKSPEAQSNATVFLAKFYGRAGLLNLISNAGNDEPPAVFRSLLYEACGRIVNPIYGSVGLLWSGKWQMCQAAVEAVLKGDPIVVVQHDHKNLAAPANLLHNINQYNVAAYDIRHVSQQDKIKKKRKSSDATCCYNNKKPKQQQEEDDEQASSSAASSDVSQAEHKEQEEEQQLGLLDLSLGFTPMPTTGHAGEPGFVGFRFL